MHEKQRIDFFAEFSKGLIDLFSNDKDIKEIQKLGIDAAAKILKKSVDFRYAPIVRIQAAAHRHNLDRVTLFPCTANGNDLWLFRMYGGDIALFCADLGILPIQGDSLKVNPIYLDIMEHQHGIIIYERNNQKR